MLVNKKNNNYMKNKKKLIKMMPIISLCMIVLGLLFIAAVRINMPTKRIAESEEVLRDFNKLKGQIPHKLFEQSEGIVIIPEMLNIGLGIGGTRGKGIAMVKFKDGKWSNPSFITITGGSIGFQIGVQSVDLMLIFKHRSTLLELEKGTFKLGGQIAAAVGPMGRDATASTDYKLDAEIYSYSRSKGLFAGITLKGEVLDIDKKSNLEFYKIERTTREIFTNENSFYKSLISLNQTLTNMK